MRKIKKNNFGRDELITLKDEIWLRYQKVAGKCVANVFSACAQEIKNQTPNLSLKNLEEIAISKCKEMDCSPTFLGYRGFPSAICTSVNEQVVHGIATDYVLQEGDLISVDLGATYNGAIADAARTWIYGEPKEDRHVVMLEACKEALQRGIDAVIVGNQIGAIGHRIYKYVVGGSAGHFGYFGLVTDFGGHGLDWNQPHADPFVSNRSEPWEGARIVPGLAIAIEPMLTLSFKRSVEVPTRILDDKWTVVTDSLSCHFEDSVTVMEDGVHVVTGGNSEDTV